VSVRSDLEAQFQADWADIPALAPFRVVATERDLDDIKTPTALLRQKGIRRLSQAPLSHVGVRVLLCLISPHLDADRAAEQLDEAVPAALEYLRTRYRIEDEAEMTGYGKRLAYDITLHVIAPNTPLTT
jgi:hypothetical protein